MSALTDRELLEMAAKLSAYIGTRDRRIANRQRRKGMSDKTYTVDDVETAEERAVRAEFWADYFAGEGYGDGPALLRAYAVTLRQNPGRGVTEAMVKRVADALSVDGWDIGGDRADFEADIRAALEAALSAEPAAQGDAVPVAFLNTKYRALFHASEIGCTERNADLIASGELVRLYTAPPAQPAERVPDGWVLVPRDPTESQIKAMQSAWAKKEKDAPPLRSTTAMVLYFAALAATLAAPAEEGDGKEVSRG